MAMQLKNLPLYPFTARDLRIPNSKGSEQYAVIYYPENTSFLDSYSTLKIRRQDVRKAYVVGSTYPKVIVTAQMLKTYRSLGIIPVRDPLVIKDNCYVDLSYYLDAVDARFKKDSYRRGVVSSRIKGYLNGIRGSLQGRQKVFMYVVNMDKEIPRSLWFRRIFPVWEMYKEEGSPFDYFVINVIRDGVSHYQCLAKPGQELEYSRVRVLLSKIQSKKPNFVIDDESDAAAAKTVSMLQFDPNPGDTFQTPDPDTKIVGQPGDVDTDPYYQKVDDERITIRSAMTSYLKKLPATLRRKILSRGLDKDSAYTMATKAILYSVSGDLLKSTKVVDNTPIDQRKYMFDRVKRELLTDVVVHDLPQNNSRDPLVSAINIPALLENKEPSHILNKRKQDFETSFERDLRAAFKLLEKKDYPLNLFKLKRVAEELDPGDLNPTYYDKYEVILQDPKRKSKKHLVDIRVPRLMDDNSFTINGKKKYLIYQIVLDPIYFIKEGQAKFESLYAPIAINWKKTKAKSYFHIRIGGYKLPLAALLGYYLGFETMAKLFKFTFSIKNEHDPTKLFYELSDGNFVVLEQGNETAEVLFNSLQQIPYQFSSQEILSRDSFQKAIVAITGNRNCMFRLNEVLENIMEPVSVQILKTKLLPFTLPQILYYICDELIKGRVDDRNDISHQRIRSSEVFAHQIQKLILGAYNNYRFKRVSGDIDAEYVLDVTQAVKEVINSKLVRDLENINPTEELSCLTRITPVGEGGVPDANAITKGGRNIHKTYYGNVDSMDTPEGGNVGIINQLSVDASITSGRGSFIDKDDEGDLGNSALGVNSVMIPFIGSCDGARVMFSGSQGRQAIPINGVEAPIVQTGYESILTSILSDSYIKKAIADGKVVSITENVITIKLKSGKLQKISLEPQLLRAGQGQSSLNYFNPIVKEGQNVKKNQIVAEGKHVVDGMIATGTNLLCAVMNWKGYSYEDGYIISDRVAKKKLTSPAYHEVEVVVKSADNVLQIVREGIETKRGEPLLTRTSKEIEQLVGLDIDEIQAGQIITKSPGGKLVSLEIYPNVKISRFPELVKPFHAFRDKYLETHGKFPTKFTSKIGSSKEQFSGVLIRFKLEEQQVAELGDKITNHYGGKGCIALIEEEKNMPLTPWGEHVDVILNPIAIINRMNPSTLLELHTSLVSKFLAKKLVALGSKKNLKAIKLVEAVIGALDKTDKQSIARSMAAALRNMSERKYSKYIQDIVDRDYIFPIIIPPFKAPSYEDVLKALALVGGKAEYNLFLKEFGQKTIKPIAVGYLYYKKLEQQSGIKMSARSTGMVNAVTRQATQGKKAGGGQRIGELDSYALINHGATNVLREFFGPLSDDHVTKDQIISEIVQGGSSDYRVPKTSPTRDLFHVYMAGLMLEPDV